MRGFLGTDAPLAIDLIVVLLVFILPMLAWSIVQVRAGNRDRHRQLQIGITTALAIALLLFEVQVRTLGGWRAMIADRDLTVEQSTLIGYALAVHLVFAITTPLLWIGALVTSSLAWTGQQPRRHRLVGRLAAGDFALTALTGWLWYWMAFIW